MAAAAAVTATAAAAAAAALKNDDGYDEHGHDYDDEGAANERQLAEDEETDARGEAEKQKWKKFARTSARQNFAPPLRFAGSQAQQRQAEEEDAN